MLLEIGDCLQALALGDIRDNDVDHKGILARTHRLDSFLSVLDLDHVVSGPLEVHAYIFSDVRLILDDHYTALGILKSFFGGQEAQAVVQHPDHRGDADHNSQVYPESHC